ncbi:hypothetical protein BD777DRAFT_138730 [Yarrowia lipolytica]|nr:hypothetical protein BD777DRAFT_138730 [Yarrowia lipolytica]
MTDYITHYVCHKYIPAPSFWEVLIFSEAVRAIERIDLIRLTLPGKAIVEPYANRKYGKSVSVRNSTLSTYTKDNNVRQNLPNIVTTRSPRDSNQRDLVYKKCHEEVCRERKTGQCHFTKRACHPKLRNEFSIQHSQVLVVSISRIKYEWSKYAR